MGNHMSFMNTSEFGKVKTYLKIEPIEYPFSLSELMEAVEANAMMAALQRTRGHKNNASKSLGMWRGSFDRKYKKYGLDGYGKGQV